MSLLPGYAHPGEDFPHASFALLAGLEARSFWFRARSELIVWALQRFFPDARNFLDVGCGTGFVLAELERRLELELVGGELDPAGLEIARRRLPGIPLFQLDARHIPFSNAFDVVGAFDVIEHVREDDRVLAEMRNACRAGGGILITVPQHPWLWSGVDEFSGHKRRYTARQLLAKLEAVGFEVVHHTSFVALLLPVVALARLRRINPETYDPATEHRLPTAVSRIFDGTMNIERRLILKHGLRIPFGLSLLVVARRRG